MNFLKLFLRGIAILPSLVQGIESIYGAKSGADKRTAVLDIVSSAVKITDAVANKNIANADAFTKGLGTVIDGVVTCMNASMWAK